jgi:hypothetical protein
MGRPIRAFGRTVAPVEMRDAAKRAEWGLPEPGSEEPGLYIVELNAQHRGGLPGAEIDFFALFRAQVQGPAEMEDSERASRRAPVRVGESYYRCELTDDEWRRLVAEDERKSGPTRAILRLWPDFKVRAYTDRSVATIKSDAALNSFGAAGEDITWAVIDSGVDVTHSHFGDASTSEGRAAHLLLNDAVRDLHRNFADLFTGTGDERLPQRPLDSPDWDASLAPEARASLVEEHRNAALRDDYGHGTHVAGIIAGERLHLSERRSGCWSGNSL